MSRFYRGFVIWEGASLLDGAPVVLIATRGTKGKANQKTGAMIQTYILRSDIGPIDSAKAGKDASICGECQHRPAHNGTCYVRLDTGPNQVYKAYKRGVYPWLSMREVQAQWQGERVRLGAYGDPCAVPLAVWSAALEGISGCTGYTHGWKTAERGLERYCMASCDSLAEDKQAQGMGWRTFTVLAKNAPIVPSGSFLCPASAEAGKRLTCSECMACGGLSSPNRASVYIPVHGVAFKVQRFTNLIQIGKGV